MLDLSSVVYDPGAKYLVSARVRVEKKKDGKGQAFWSGVYDYKHKREAGRGFAPSVAAVKDGYQWYPITAWRPADGHSFWFGPGTYDKKKTSQSPAHDGVYLDCIKIERVE